MRSARPAFGSPLVYLVIGAGCMGGMIYGMFTVPDMAYQSYLFAYLFWLGISLGSLAIRMIWQLTDGAWGVFIHEPLVLASRLLPLLAVLFVPICFALPRLFLWAQDAPAHADLIAKKQWYLNETVFYVRAAACLVLWSIAPFVLDRLHSLRWRRRFSALGLILFAYTTYAVGVDWIMSINLVYSSSVFGLIVASGMLLSAFASAIVSAYAVMREDPDWLPERLAARLNDLGNLLLVFVLGWCYVTVTQFVTVWIADLPRENAWYLPRLNTDWYIWGIVFVVLDFVVPVALLLSRRIKRSPVGLAAVAAVVLVGQLAYAYWQVAPNLRTGGMLFYWTDPAAVGAIGGLWLWIYLWLLRRPRRGAVAEQAVDYG